MFDDKTHRSAIEKLLATLDNVPWYERLWWFVYRKFYDLKSLPRKQANKIRWARQRKRQGFSYDDTRNLDLYLAMVISEGVRVLRDTGAGHPINSTAQQWYSTQTSIIAAFETYLLVQTRDDAAPTKLEKARFDLGFQLLHEHFHSLWS